MDGKGVSQLTLATDNTDATIVVLSLRGIVISGQPTKAKGICLIPKETRSESLNTCATHSPDVAEVMCGPFKIADCHNIAAFR